MFNLFKNKKPLTRTQVEKARFGNVFIVNDKQVFNPKGAEKPRRVVLVGKKDGSLQVAPVKRSSPYQMELSNFDGNRSVILGKTVTITKNKVYSKRDFRGTSNDYLTTSEKVKLKKKILGK